MSEQERKKKLDVLNELMSYMGNSGADLGASQEYNNLLQKAEILGGGYNPIAQQNTGAVMFRDGKGNKSLQVWPIHKSENDMFMRDTPYMVSNFGGFVPNDFKGDTVDPYYITDAMGFFDGFPVTKDMEAKRIYSVARKQFLNDRSNWEMVHRKEHPSSRNELKSLMEQYANNYASSVVEERIPYRKNGGLIKRIK